MTISPASQTAPPRAARTSSHCSTRTRPAQTGIRATPRSVPGERRVEPVVEVGQPGDRRAADAWPPTGGTSPADTSSASVAHRGVDPRPLHLGGLRAPRCGSGRSAACRRAPRSRWSRLSGSGRSLENHEATGHPVARLARIRVDFSTASTTVGTPAALGERVVERRDPLLRTGCWAVARPVAASTFSAGGIREVGLEPGADGLLGRHPAGDLGPQLVDALALAGADAASTGTPPGRRRRAAGVRRRASTRGGPPGTVSMWLSTTSMTSWWVASGAR